MRKCEFLFLRKNTIRWNNYWNGDFSLVIIYLGFLFLAVLCRTCFSKTLIPSSRIKNLEKGQKYTNILTSVVVPFWVSNMQTAMENSSIHFQFVSILFAAPASTYEQQSIILSWMWIPPSCQSYTRWCPITCRQLLTFGILIAPPTFDTAAIFHFLSHFNHRFSTIALSVTSSSQ